MGILNLFRKEKELPESDRKWNRMWDLWEEGKVPSPYAELMNYEGEVNNGGHSQYFFNTANCGNLEQEIRTVLAALPAPLYDNLKRAYDAFSSQEDICSDENDELFEQCDGVFYKNEGLLLNVLKAYAENISL